MNFNEYSDFKLIEEFKLNSKKSTLFFSELNHRYNKQIYWQIRRFTKNHDDTNDILQNVWIKVWKNLQDFKFESSFYTWLYRIAKNETLNYIQKEKKHLSNSLDLPLIEIIPGNKTLDCYSGEQINELLLNAIANLPEKQSIVFQLKYFEDLKYSEISTQLNVSEGGLKANYFHAVKKIEEYILNQLNHLS
jgi:RNA polymerase sigma-70 factor (ECF subfamily)